MNEVYSQRTLTSFTNDYKSLVFVIRQLMGKMITIVPVRVSAVTNSGSLASDAYVNVQPLLNQMTGNGAPIPHRLICNVPVFRIQGGSSALLVDPSVGDIGLMLVAYRDSSSLVAADKASPGSLQGSTSTFNPGSSAQYDWGSGVYMGGYLNGAVTQYIQLTASECKIVAPTISLNGATVDNSGDVTAPQLSAGNGFNGVISIQNSTTTITVANGIITGHT